ncbi:ATP-grasp domain-containing protein [Gracilimonas sp.]|uniref:ATP-grasp domain-containing protein n=1 Tax=Gracilimonas sp. TaxID=1974203 RepID=UPI003BA8FE2F
MVLLYKSDIWEVPKYNKFYEAILEYNDISYEKSNLNDTEFWDKVEEADYFIYRFVNTEYQIQEAETIFPIIEDALGKNVFPNLRSRWHFDDKIKQYYLLKELGFPVIDTHVFWNKKDAIKWVEGARYPVIFKLKSGAGSANVAKIDNKRQAHKVVARMFKEGINNGKIPLGNNLIFKSPVTFIKSLFYNLYTEKKYGVKKLFWKKHMNYVLFQKYLANNEYDIRVTIIGDRAYAFLRYNRDNDFRASGSGKLEYNQDKIDKEAIKIAFNVSETCGFDSMAYDFLYDENNKLKICEISYTYLDEVLYDCPGIYDRDLNFEKGNFLPAFLHLKKLLDNKHLKHPDLDINEI